MKRGVRLGLLVVLVPVVACAVAWLGYTALNYDWRPNAMDRAEMIREALKPTLFNKEGIEIVSCKYVNSSALDEARKTHPTLQIVDCVFNHKDGLGNPQIGNKHHFFILDDRVIFFQGLSFAEVHSSDPDLPGFILGIVERNKVPRDLQAEGRAAQKSGKGPPGMGGFKSKGGKAAGGKAKEEKSTSDKGQPEKSAAERGKETKPAPAKDTGEKSKDTKQ